MKAKPPSSNTKHLKHQRRGFYALAWCRDHIVLLSVVLFFPLTLVGFYWGSPGPEDNPPPNYLASEPADEDVHAVLPVEEPAPAALAESPKPDAPPLESVEPPPLTETALPVEPLPNPAADGFSAINVSEVPALVGGPNFPAMSSSEAQDLNCVWLTGTIEAFPAEDSPVPQQAARVHVSFPASRN